jgi:hypothetical protein
VKRSEEISLFESLQNNERAVVVSLPVILWHQWIMIVWYPDADAHVSKNFNFFGDGRRITG